MDTLKIVVESVTDTLTILTTPKEVISNSCPAATTSEDIYLALVIGVTIIVGLAIVGRYTYKSIASVQQAKLNELEKRQTHELAKLDKEATIKTAATELNAQNTANSAADKLKNKEKELELKLKEARINLEIAELGKKNAPKEDSKS